MGGMIIKDSFLRFYLFIFLFFGKGIFIGDIGERGTIIKEGDFGKEGYYLYYLKG